MPWECPAWDVECWQSLEEGRWTQKHRGELECGKIGKSEPEMAKKQINPKGHQGALRLPHSMGRQEFFFSLGP